MGIASVESLQAGLLGGLAPETPVAIVQHASLPAQRHAVCRLDALADIVMRERFASPAIIVVGDVVRAGLTLAGARRAGERDTRRPSGASRGFAGLRA